MSRMSRKNRKISKPILIFPIEGGCDTVCMKKLYTFWSVVEVYEHVNHTIILRSPRSKDYKGEWYSVTICEDNPQKLIVTHARRTRSVTYVNWELLFNMPTYFLPYL